MKEPVWLLPDIVLAIHQLLIAEHGGATGLGEARLLESALARPRQKFSYDDKISLHQLAAAYSFGLAKNHPFIDGNKRVALTIAGTFLELNGHIMTASEAETVIVFRRLADGSVDEAWLSHWLVSNSSVAD